MRNIIASIAAATLLIGTPALAQDSAKSVKVRTADLDLSSNQGRAKLNRRIAAAVESVCGSYASASSYEERDIARCRAKAGDQVTTQVAARSRTTRLAKR